MKATDFILLLFVVANVGLLVGGAFGDINRLLLALNGVAAVVCALIWGLRRIP